METRAADRNADREGLVPWIQEGQPRPTILPRGPCGQQDRSGCSLAPRLLWTQELYLPTWAWRTCSPCPWPGPVITKEASDAGYVPLTASPVPT